MILNQQNVTKVDLAGAEAFAAQLRKILGLGSRDFNVCFVDDPGISVLNGAYRGKSKPTDVLSFPWNSSEAVSPSRQANSSDPGREFEGFLGDVVISVEAAHRNAEVEGHAASTEISWLILHGLLHLLGMDHETDHGEMVALEHDLRARLGVTEKARASKRITNPSLKRPPSREAERAGGPKRGKG